MAEQQGQMYRRSQKARVQVGRCVSGNQMAQGVVEHSKKLQAEPTSLQVMHQSHVVGAGVV